MDTKKPSKKPAKKPTAAKGRQGPRPPGGEKRWVRACLELCGGSFEAPIRCKTWREAFTRLEAARADFVRDTTRKAGSYGADARWAPPPTLPFGAETWTRREPPDALRVAFERCGLLFPDLVDGAGDPQTDTFPVAVAVYDRDWDAVEEADDGACSYVLGKAGAGNAALAESLYKLAAATGSKALEALEDDDVHQLVGKVRTVRQLLEAGPSPVLAPRADLLRGRCLELMVTKAIADCDAFVAFCASRLTPAQGLKVARDAVQSLGYGGDSLRATCADCDGAVRLAAVAPEDNDGDVYVVGADAVARKLREAAAAVAGGGVPEFPLAFAETDVEAFLKDVLRREDGALREAIRRELRAAEGLPERPTPRKGARVLAPWTDGTLYAANCVEIKILRRVRRDACPIAWLPTHWLISTQAAKVTAVEGASVSLVFDDGDTRDGVAWAACELPDFLDDDAVDSDEDDESDGNDDVVPLALSLSDRMSLFGAGLKDGSNDHEGHMACVYVAPTWALLLLYKTSSC